MTLMVVRHHVSDYDAWLKVYTSVGQLQKFGGVLEESIHQDAKDPLERAQELPTAERLVATLVRDRQAQRSRAIPGCLMQPSATVPATDACFAELKQQKGQ